MPLSRRSAYCLPLLFATCLGLSACSGPTALQQALRPLPERVELTEVPAFPERAYQGAPTALASLLVQQGVDTSPGLQAKALQLPEAEARLQQNMLAQVNSHGLLVYPLQPSLPALLEQVAAGLPVLLRFNEGMAWVDMPRYAVLVGYDREEQTLLLRAGNSRRWRTSFCRFGAANCRPGLMHSAGWRRRSRWRRPVTRRRRPMPGEPCSAVLCLDKRAAGVVEFLLCNKKCPRSCDQRAFSSCSDCR